MSPLPPPVAVSKVAHARRWLGAIAVARAMLWSAATLLALLTLGTLVQKSIGSFLHDAMAPWLITMFAAAGVMVVLGVMLWRERFVWSRRRVALWIEERMPQLQYALVTRADPGQSPTPLSAALDAAVAAIELRPALRAAAVHALVAPALTLIAIGVAVAVMPLSWRENGAAAVAARKAAPPNRPLGNRLLELTGTLRPPAYTGWPARTLTDPKTIATVSGLTGSQVVLGGQGTADGIEATLGQQPIAVSDGGAGWTLSFALPQAPAALTLVDRRYRRILVLDPHPDESPVLKLRLPASDIVLRTVAGSVTFDAEVRDEVGIAAAHFEYIVASGGGEGSYTFRTGTFAAREFQRDTRTACLRATLPYAWFKLKEGDQLSVRALAVDGNSLSGPGKGYSETRIVRVLRKNASAPVDVDRAPPHLNPAEMSLRMLIVATEKLDRRRSYLPREDFTQRVKPLADKAKAIRNRIQGFVDERGGAPQRQEAQEAQVAQQDLNFTVPPLLSEALTAMIAATSSMNIAETGEALPQMRRAYSALGTLSAASRYIVRGQAVAAPVEIERVRMKGTEPAAASARAPRAVAAIAAERFAARYRYAVERLPHDRAGAVEELTLLRVQALRDLPPLAAALGKALDAMQAGGDPAAALLEARHAIEGAPRAEVTRSSWSPLP